MDDSILGLLNSFIASFSPSYIYDGAYFIATRYMSAISGTLLTIAIFIRLMNSSVDSLGETGKYAGFLKALFVWGVILSMYFALAGLVTDFFNVLYEWSQRNGSVSRIMGQLGIVLEDLDQKRLAQKEEYSFAFSTAELLNNVPRFFSYVFFFVSFVLVVFVELFLHLAQALGFAVALIFGTIAIPLAVSDKFSVLVGWAKFSAAILLWPIIEALLMFLLLGLTNQLSIDVSNYTASNIGAAGIYLLFCIMNLVMAATIVAAPFITMALVSNSGSIQGLVSPFVAGALGATAAVSKTLYNKGGGELLKQGALNLDAATKRAGGSLGSMALNGIKSPINAAKNAMFDSSSSGSAGTSDSSSGGLSYSFPGAQNYGGPGTMSASYSPPVDMGGGGSPVSDASVADVPGSDSGAHSRNLSPEAQAKRGAIINQMKKMS